MSINNPEIYSPDDFHNISTLYGKRRVIVNLIANGFSYQEAAQILGTAHSTFKHNLSNVYELLGMQDALQMSLAWYRFGNFELAGLNHRVNLKGFNSLTKGERRVVDIMVMDRGHTDDEIAQELVLAPSTAKNTLSSVRERVSKGNGVTRVAIAIGYEMYKDPTPVKNMVVLGAVDQSNDVDILNLLAQGLTNQEISNQLGKPPLKIGMAIRRLLIQYGLDSRWALADAVNKFGRAAFFMEYYPKK